MVETTSPEAGGSRPDAGEEREFENPAFSRSIIYAACLEGSDPIRLFEKRLNVRREPGYEFDKASLSYNHMSSGEPPVTVDTIEEADQLLRDNEKESAIGNPVKVFLFLLLNFTWPSALR
ncbi:uncharacterized protein LOC133856653 [Alnus glutinosa]|uniref:uncharacterized protein LOC133856653 n=1 Tax=Alnus glutinosa TaxID=3517 RepID=UPI002D76B58B|nr:uncharacterized protein LOC133856653 [Alnus glutinosa]